MDARVSLVLVAVLATACIGSGGDPVGPGSEDACRPRNLELERTGGADHDPGLWDVEVLTPRGTETCAASRGGWLCSSPRFDGRASGREAGVARGLARRTAISLASEDNAEVLGYRYTVRRNGVTRYSGPAVCGSAPCGAGNGNFRATLPLGGPE